MYSLFCLRNLHAPTTRQSIGSTSHRGTFRQLELEQLHVPAMDVSFHNRLLIFKRAKGLSLNDLQTLLLILDLDK
jgi:hypothetical protein